jgi:hypothetical protein
VGNRSDQLVKWEYGGTYIAQCMPCFAKADEIGVSGSIAKYGTSPTITTDTNMYKEQQIDNAVAIPKGRSRCGFFTCSMIMEELGILFNVNKKILFSLKNQQF